MPDPQWTDDTHDAYDTGPGARMNGRQAAPDDGPLKGPLHGALDVPPNAPLDAPMDGAGTAPETESEAARRRRRAQFLRELHEAKELRNRVQPRRVRAARMRQAMRMRSFRW
ncbi:hypothetical protein [Streptomyces sp. NPDC001657]|uniref:hypothetical protein n=1 Tax=Streptomyces sp. NPDC001657 TaxID=3154522 RepID=UPI0033238D3C